MPRKQSNKNNNKTLEEFGRIMASILIACSITIIGALSFHFILIIFNESIKFGLIVIHEIQRSAEFIISWLQYLSSTLLIDDFQSIGKYNYSEELREKMFDFTIYFFVVICIALFTAVLFYCRSHD